jgi:hypothetical protein
MTIHYPIYGLNLTANIALPGPTAMGSEQSEFPIVEVTLGSLPSWLTERPDESDTAPNWYPSNSFELEQQPISQLQVWQIDRDRHFYCYYRDGTIFVVSRLGDRIWATWPENLTIEDTATYLLGPILGFVLRLRGTVCLHANAIAIDDRVIAIVGESGAGKSTTAAAFAERGYGILSDDVVPIVECGDTFTIQPAYPRIRLWNNSVRALYGEAESLPRLVPTHPTWDKRYLDLNQSGYKFQSESLPLAAIYYLQERSDDPACPQISPMTIPEQLITLVSNTYANYLLDKSLRAGEFEFLSRVVTQIPVRQIVPHSEIARLPELVDAIISDFRSTTSVEFLRK